jgi:NADP-dependent 3-hydroxy acid dehydrogenase YdfG
MYSWPVLVFLIAATATSGLLAGASLDQSSKQLPARHRIGAIAFSRYSQAADLGNGIAAVLPTFVEQKSGQVIATSSVAGLKAYPGGAIYGGTKWFVRDFMEVLRMESAMERTNIRTSTIYPAAINTELLELITHEGTSEAMHKTYDQYGISPDRVANVVAFAIDQPEDTTVNEFTIGPANQPW